MLYTLSCPLDKNTEISGHKNFVLRHHIFVNAIGIPHNKLKTIIVNTDQVSTWIETRNLVPSDEFSFLYPCLNSLLERISKF